MNTRQLIEELKNFDGYAIVICEGENSGWDNIQEVKSEGGLVKIIFGGELVFSDE